MVKPRSVSDIKGTLMDVALTSHYALDFGGLPTPLRGYLNQKGISSSIIEKIGLLCYDSSLPATALATNNIEGNYTGVQQQYAHTRTFPNIDMGFYCDSEYRVLSFFESWIEYISGGGASQNLAHPGYFYRMRFPDAYKGNIAIDKFDRDYTKGVRYTFIRMFPVSVSPIPISYEASQLLRINVTFNYERYILTSSYTQKLASLGKKSNSTSADELARQLSSQSEFLKTSNSFDIANSGNTNFSAFINSYALNSPEFKDAASQFALDSWLSNPPSFNDLSTSGQNINFTGEVGGVAGETNKTPPAGPRLSRATLRRQGRDFSSSSGVDITDRENLGFGGIRR